MVHFGGLMFFCRGRALAQKGGNLVRLGSTLIRHGVQQFSVIERELTAWMAEHEYESVQQLKGSLSQKHCADPEAFEWAQYMRAISSYQVPTA
jgi:dihydroorotate dehydrogenase (fumarate)